MDEEPVIPVDPDGAFLVQLALRDAEWDAPSAHEGDRVEYPDDEAPVLSEVEAAIVRATYAAEVVNRQSAELWAAVLVVVREAESHPGTWLDSRVRVDDTEASDVAVRAAVADLAVRMHLSETTIRTMGENARRLAHCPRVWSAFRAGRISPAVARTVADTLANLPDEVWTRFDEQIVDAATRLAPGRFRAVAHRVRDRVHRVSVAERRARAESTRRIALDHDLDGMSWLSLYLPSAVAEEAHGRITAIAHDLAEVKDETRSLDQLRADIASDLLRQNTLGSGPAGPAVQLTLTVPAATMVGGDAPGILDGVGEVSADTARRLAAFGTSFARAITHPETGTVLRVDPDEYRLPAALRRAIQTRDRVCRFPGCLRRAKRCDIDHIHEAQHGAKSTPCNLMCLCRHHHRIKTLTTWAPEPPDPDIGTVNWTSPTGHHSDSDPPPF